jgi:glycosyltransferase involved in cell wall biosynthesis
MTSGKLRIEKEVIAPGRASHRAVEENRPGKHDSSAAHVDMQDVMRLVQDGDVPQAMQLLRKAITNTPPPKDAYLLAGVCASSVTYKHLAYRAAEKELHFYPENTKAQQLRDFCLQTSSAVRSQDVPGRLRVSFIATYISPSDSFVELLESLRWQSYGSFELVVVVRGEEHEKDAQQLLRNDPRVKIVRCATSSISEALTSGFACATGELQGLLTSPTIRWSDNGLANIVEVFSKLPQIHWVTCERTAVDALNVPFPCRYDLPKWSQQLILDPDNFTTPVLKIPTWATLWRSSLFKECGARFDSKLVEAYDYELFARFSERAELFSIKTTLAACGEPLEAKSDKVTTLYKAETAQVCARYLKQPGFKAREEAPPIISFSTDAEIASKKTYAIPEAKKLSVLPEIHLPTRTKISLVTPSFNQAEFLQATIESVVSQRGVELEYYILDGGSTDGSCEIIRKYERYLTGWSSGPDGGQYHAIQEGLRKTSGTIMSWLNSDDILVPDALALVADVFRSAPEVRWITGRIGALNSDGSVSSGKVVPFYSGERYIAGGFDEPWIQQEGTFWHRDLWNRAGGALDLSWSLAADLELWVRFFRFASVCPVDSSIALYREHDNRRSALHRARYFREAEAIIQRESDLISRGLVPRPAYPLPIFKLEQSMDPVFVASYPTNQIQAGFNR